MTASQAGTDPSGAGLQLHLLGPPKMVWAETPLALARQQTHALLYCLGVHLQPVPREALGLLLWPELPAEKVRRNLARILYLLRRELPSPDLVLVSGEMIQLDPNRVWSDTVVFEQLATEAQESIEELERAVALCRGPLLSGFSLSGSAEFEMWLEQERHFFEHRYRQCLTKLVDLTARRQDTARAITYARRYLAHDELAEEMHRCLIELYAASGDRAAAQRQYEQCTAILTRELGVSPLPETQATYQRSLAQFRLPQIPPAPQPAWSTLPGLDMPLVV